MSIAANLLLLAVAVPVAGTAAYLLLLTLLSARLRPPPPGGGQLRFDIVVPAHNESQVIDRVLGSLLRIHWPPGQWRVLVVADNCSDDTADKARAHGVTVLERRDPMNRGKGHALQYAFARSARDARADAVVVIDSDSEVTPNLLAAFAARLAAGEHAVQAHYGILNPMASWRTRLLTIAKSAFHIVRSRARERLGVSCGIRGNGWCVTHDLLRRVPYACFSLTEDLEYGVVLGLAGQRVAYADDANADAEMASSGKVAGTQRQRWESGRFALMRDKLPQLLRAAARGSATCADLALDLLVLPLTYVALGCLLLLGLAFGAHAAGLGWNAWPAVAAAAAAALVLHVVVGWAWSGVGLRGLIDLLRVPGFIAWRLLLALKPAPRTWVRTDREDS